MELSTTKVGSGPSAFRASVKKSAGLRRNEMRAPGLVPFSMIALMTVGFAAVSTRAEDVYPTRPIRVIVPVGPGAGLDNAARISAEAVEKHLGQRLILENKPGAGQRIAAAFVAKSTPGGYTLPFNTPTPT